MKNLLPHVQRLRGTLLLLPLLCVVLFANKAVAQDWSTIGNGLPFWTHAVCEYNGEIIAGGEAPGFLKRFDGVNWAMAGLLGVAACQQVLPRLLRVRWWILPQYT